MIRRIYVSEIDRTNLSKLKTARSNEVDKTNYKNLVVQKPWGYEYLMFENDYVAIWILHLKKNQSTSIHCHPRKKSSLIVLSGKVLTSTLTEWFEFDPLQGVVYNAGVFHSTKALQDDTFIMETESPPDKRDLVRLKDAYGREHKGYEGKNQHSKDLKKFKYVYFDKDDIKRGSRKKLDNVYISIRKCVANSINRELKQKINLQARKIYSIIEGKVIEPEYNAKFWPGAIFNSDDLRNKKEIKLYNNCLLLILESE